MRGPGFGQAMIIVSTAFALVGCGTPKEKTAPCKRPANLTGYVADRGATCGPMWAVNTDRKSTLATIDDLADQSE